MIGAVAGRYVTWITMGGMVRHGRPDTVYRGMVKRRPQRMAVKKGSGCHVLAS